MTKQKSKILTGKDAQKKVKGALKKFIIQYEEGVSIGVEFPDEMGGELDTIEKIFGKSIQVTDVGERPIQMEYKLHKGVKWESFTEGLEDIFNIVFNHKPKK